MTLCVRCQKFPVPMSGKAVICSACSATPSRPLVMAAKRHAAARLPKRVPEPNRRPLDISTAEIERLLAKADQDKRRHRWVSA